MKPSIRTLLLILLISNIPIAYADTIIFENKSEQQVLLFDQANKTFIANIFAIILPPANNVMPETVQIQKGKPTKEHQKTFPTPYGEIRKIKEPKKLFGIENPWYIAKNRGVWEYDQKYYPSFNDCIQDLMDYAIKHPKYRSTFEQDEPFGACLHVAENYKRLEPVAETAEFILFANMAKKCLRCE